MKGDFLDVLHILSSDHHDLKFLASLSKYEIFGFYQGADLTGLDLSGQDLRGLNFEKADLRGAKVENVLFDKGAFNGAWMDDVPEEIRDEYDIFIDDICLGYLDHISLHYRFRPHFIDDVLNAFNVYYNRFSESANVSTATVRRVRDGDAIANESIFGVVKALKEVLERPANTVVRERMVEQARQPFVQIGYYDSDGAWIPVPRRALEALFHELDFVNTLRFGDDWQVTKGANVWRSKPNTVKWMFNFYQRHPTAWGFSEEEIAHAQEAAGVLPNSLHEEDDEPEQLYLRN